ncbi:hypothetical protein AMECASPLE_022023 [Ameca splendens]|uniref:Dirigent protein n=1 Tax=Ameca splendens TaxID=208324 RepID=A0ABV0Z244_9TELE
MNIFFLQAYLWAFNTTTFGPPTEDLTTVTGAELASRAVPHVSMVTNCLLVQADSFGWSTFLTAPTGAPHFGQTLQRNGEVTFRNKGGKRTELLEETKKTTGAHRNAAFLLILFSSGAKIRV